MKGSNDDGFHFCYFVLVIVLCSLSQSQAFHKDYLTRRLGHPRTPNFAGFVEHNDHDIQVIIPNEQDKKEIQEVEDAYSASEGIPMVQAASQPLEDTLMVMKKLSEATEKIAQQNVETAAPQKVDTTTSTSKLSTSTEAPTSSSTLKNVEITTEIMPQSSKKEEVTIKPNDKVTTVVSSSTVTESSTAGTRVASSTEASVTVSPTTSITTLKPPVEKDSHPKDLYCLCDIHVNTCDMNCCCDTDCGIEDKALFTKCEDGLGLYDPRRFERRQRSCIQNFIFIKNYEANNLVRTNDGLLCIVRDNNKADNVLPVSKLGELREKILQGTLSIQRKYEWTKKSDEKYKKSFYKYGSPILGLKTSLEPADRKKPVPFGLPFPYHGESCSIHQPVLFLQAFRSKCKYSLGNLSSSCEVVNPLDGNYFLQLLDIIANPGDDQYESVPITRSKSCHSGRCTTEPSQRLIPGDFPSPTINSQKRMCQDVLVKLNLTIVHAGIDGLVEIFASGEFQDISLDETSLLQEYRVDFEWTEENADNATNPNATTAVVDHTDNTWPRSGNPGYIVGKPVIMGKKVSVSLKNQSKSDEFEKSKVVMQDRIKVWKDPTRWLTIHSPGICSNQPLQTPRVPTLFDYSHSSSCSLNISRFKYCEDLQEEVAKVLLGTEDYLTYDKTQWYVAAYGNSDPEVPSEWIPVSFNNFPIYTQGKGLPKSLISKGCDGIFSNMHIRIAYAFVGSLDFPQARITGVLYELGDSVPVQRGICSPEDSSCLADSQDLVATTTVTFKDVTEPPMVVVGTWPVVSIRLPRDFFYPFTSSSSPAAGTSGSSGINKLNSHLYFLFLSHVVIISLYFIVKS